MIGRLGAALACIAGSGCATAPGVPARTSESEAIYVFRTHRTSSVEGATPACASAPFAVRQEDVYALHGVAIDRETGLVTDPSASAAEGFTACLGAFQADGTFGMYAAGTFDGHPYTGLNVCALAPSQPVEGGLLLHCHGLLDSPPEGYRGGYLTSSTLAPLGGADEVGGHTSTSIVTMRLWPAR